MRDYKDFAPDGAGGPTARGGTFRAGAVEVARSDGCSHGYSWEVTVDFFPVEAANECDRAVLENKTHAVIAYANTIILARGFEAFEVGNLLESSGGFHMLDHFLDPAKQRGVGDGRQVCLEDFAEGGVQAARARRWKTFFRLVRRDFSPS